MVASGSKNTTFVFVGASLFGGNISHKAQERTRHVYDYRVVGE